MVRELEEQLTCPVSSNTRPELARPESAELAPPPPPRSFVPKIMITNVRSLTPKIEEVQEFLNRNDITMAFITETWLKPTIMDSVISIPGYTVLRKDRASDNHGAGYVFILGTII
jgi:hypothetical protein